MCFKLKEGITNTCSCKFAHLCKRSHKLQAARANMEINLKPAAADINMTLLGSKNTVINRYFNAQEGNNI